MADIKCIEARSSTEQEEWLRVFNLVSGFALKNGYLPFGGSIRDEIRGECPKDLDVLMPLDHARSSTSLDIMTRMVLKDFQISGYRLGVRCMDSCSGYTKINGPLLVYRLVLQYLPISKLKSKETVEKNDKDEMKTIEFGFDLVREVDLADHLHDFDVNCLVRQKDGSLRLKYGVELKLDEVIENCRKKRFRILNGPVSIPSNKHIAEMWTKLYHGILPTFIKAILSPDDRFEFGLVLPYLHMRVLYAHRLARMLNAGWSPIIDGKEINVTDAVATIQAIDHAGLVARCGEVTQDDKVKDEAKGEVKGDDKVKKNARPLLTIRQDKTCVICQYALEDQYCMRTICCAQDVHSGCLLTKLSNAHNHANNNYFDEYWANREKYYHLNPILCPICQKGDEGCTNCRGACDPYGWTPASYRCVFCRG